MLFAELFFRFASVGALLGVCALVIRDGLHIRAFRFGLLVAVSLICLFITTGPENFRISGPIAVPLRLVDMMSIFFIWWFGRALFDDDFRLNRREWIILAAFLTIRVPNRLNFMGFNVPNYEWMNLALVGAALAMMAHLIYTAISGMKQDLVEARRRARVFFAVAIAMTAAASTLAEKVAIETGGDPDISLTITTFAVLPLTIWALLWLARLYPEALTFQPAEPPRPKAPEIEPRDAAIHVRLIAVMEEERAFVEQGLTIGALAKRVGLPEHQLRALINRSMGFRNFSGFLNHYRIGEAKAALADPEKGRLPVLTIAMDAGFASLATFNRAFKASLGETPTEFRKKALANHDQN